MDALRSLDLIDRPHPPAPGSDAGCYKEWYHFNVLDAGGLDIIFNLSLNGDIGRPGEGEAKAILLASRAGSGWNGGIEVFDGAAVEMARDTTDLRVGGNSIRCREGRYQLKAVLDDPPIELEAELVAQVAPMLIWNDTPFAGGHINWLLVPALAASGRLVAEGRPVAIPQARAYHDHNWGFWRWGEDFGWIWGFSTSAEAPAGEALTIVFSRTTDREGSVVKEHTVALWRGPALLKLFTRRAVRFQRLGAFSGGPVRRIPGVMNLLRQGEATRIPETLLITAADGDGWLEAELRIDSAIQIAVPGDLGFGVAEINECFGTLNLRGSLRGEPLAFSARACFEFMG